MYSMFYILWKEMSFASSKYVTVAYDSDPMNNWFEIGFPAPMEANNLENITRDWRYDAIEEAYF